MSTEKRTEYAVARGNEVITGWQEDVRWAVADLRAVENGMRTAHLEPDVHLVESQVEVTTKRSRAKAYEPVQIEPSEPTGTEPTVEPLVEPVLPPSGIWGDEDGKIGEQRIHELAAEALQNSIPADAPSAAGTPQGDAPQDAPSSGALQEAASSEAAAESTSTEVVSTDGSPKGSKSSGSAQA